MKLIKVLRRVGLALAVFLMSVMMFGIKGNASPVSVNVDLTDYNFSFTDVYGKSHTFNANDGKVDMIIIGPLGTCSRTQGTTQSISNLLKLDCVKSGDVNVYCLYYPNTNFLSSPQNDSQMAEFLNGKDFANSNIVYADYQNNYELWYLSNEIISAVDGASGVGNPPAYVGYISKNGVLYTVDAGSLGTKTIAASLTNGGVSVSANEGGDNSQVTMSVQYGQTGLVQCWRLSMI